MFSFSMTLYDNIFSMLFRDCGNSNLCKGWSDPARIGAGEGADPDVWQVCDASGRCRPPVTQPE